MINSAYLDETDIYDANLYGTTNIGNLNSFYGTTINQGILQNNYYTYAVDFYGNLINNVTIRNYSGTLNLYAHADITNNGTWTNYFTAMLGTTDQYIHLKNGHWIDGQMRFITDVPTSPFQWYLNGLAITDPPYPQVPPFSGWDANTLVFNNPVTNGWSGTYNCLAGGTYSRNLFVDEVANVRLDVTAFLEGPLIGTKMSADLNSIIPLQQSLDVIGYEGPEAVGEIPNADIVDWIGVELRDAPDINSATEAATIGGGAFFIKNDGSIVGLDGNFMPSFDLTINNQLFVIIWHRNHLPVASMYPLAQSGGIYTYDFTTAASQAFGDNQSNLGGGKFGMIGGNANGDNNIDELDGSEAWYPQIGQTGYLSGDVNMDSQVNNQDKNDIWYPNFGKSEILPFEIPVCDETFIDTRDGQSYNAVQIGNQCWMAENLNIGIRIDGFSDQNDNTLIEKYCYNDDDANCNTYGGLYQWNEMMQYITIPGVQGICPAGWHVPTDEEWTTMSDYLDGELIAGGKMKATGTIEEGTGFWHSPNTGATNESGFTVLPAGDRYDDGNYYDLGYYPFFWSSDETNDPGLSWSRYLLNSVTSIYRMNHDRDYGFSVRCVKD
jgi:uncharacterized protein (TIGR02145 family)